MAKRSAPAARYRYLDTSVMLRLVFGEPGPRIELDNAIPTFSSDVAEIETHRAVDRERLVSRLGDAAVARKLAELSLLLGAIHLLAVSPSIVTRARASFPFPVRALDAIHVASAEQLAADLGELLDFWTHDERQGHAAQTRGLRVQGIWKP